MKFLTKNADSKILKGGIVYKVKGSNTILRNLLIEEQQNYCAYTEKFLQPLEQVDIEHFDSSKKGPAGDDYYNYYAVITTANKYKKDEQYTGASFFVNRFYQNQDELNNRIGFSNNIFYEKDENDTEARDFVDFLALNHPKLSDERKKHVKRIADHFENSGFDIEKIKEYFKKYPSELSFITALNTEYKYDFTELLN
jgi:hypothetical protein